MINIEKRIVMIDYHDNFLCALARGEIVAEATALGAGISQTICYLF